MSSKLRSDRLRSTATLSSLTVATLLLGGCVVPAGTGATSAASPSTRVSAMCVPPIPRSTPVPPPTSPDSTGAYTAAVSAAALDDAMANARALSEYQQCLSRSDSP